MVARTSSVQPAPANFAPLVAGAAVAGGVVATFFQLPGAIIAALGLTLASFFYNPPPSLNPKEPAPVDVQLAQRRWADRRWRMLLPSGDWMVNRADQLPEFREAGKRVLSRAGEKVPAVAAILSVIGEVLGMLLWLVLPTRFIHMVALGSGLAALALPANLSALAEWLPDDMVSMDLVWLNALYAFASVMAWDAIARRHAAVMDPSPGVPVSVLAAKAKQGDGGAWRAFIGFGLLGAVIAMSASLIILSLNASYLFVPTWLFGVGLGLAAAGGALHGVTRTDALEPWRDKVKTRAEWEPRWEAMKYPDVVMTDHQRVGSFTVDTFEAPPSLGSAKAINLYNTVVPYLAAGGDVTVAMLTVEALDSQGQPVPGSAHATRFRVVVAPGDAQVQTLDPAVNVDELKLAAEVGAFIAAREINAPVPILLDLTAAHTADSTAAVWQTTWTIPLASAATVAWLLGVDPDDGIFSEGRSTFFGDFGGATVADKSLPGRMEKASYEARWVQRWTDALKQGEKQPHLQYGAIKREKLGNIEISYEPFLVGQGLSPAQFFSKNMCDRIRTTIKGAPFLTVVGITGPLAGNLGPGIRHAQGFAVVHAPTPPATNPADIPSPGPRVREVAKWVMGGLINRAFEDAKLPYPEVITAEALTRPNSKGHVWKVHLRLYDGVTTAQLKSNANKFTQSLGGVRWLRFEESEHGCYVVMGAQPHADGVKFANPQALAYCDKLDWAQAFQDVNIRSVSDGASPMMLENAPLTSNDKVTRMVFSMPQGANLGKIVEATDKLRSATANDYVEVRPADTPDQFVVLAAEQNPIPFPAYPDWDQLADLSGKGAHRLPFASTTDGSTVSFDWRLDPHLNVLGASGGGKAQELTARIPVPVSHRFPAGWATVGTLEQGDLVFGQDGKTHEVTSFTPVVPEDSYIVSFDDGQELRVSGHHLWRVFTSDDRAREASSTRRRAYAERTAEADRLDDLAETVPAGLGGTAKQIAEFAGVAYDELQRAGILTHAISRQGLEKTAKTISVYSLDDLLPYLHRIIDERGSLVFAGKTLKHYDLDYLELNGAWLSVRNIADALLGRPATRDERQLAKNYVRRGGARSRIGHERRMVNLYPTGEVLRLLARYHRSIAENRHAAPAERVLHTEDMLAAGITDSRGARRFAVEMAAAFEAPAATLPVAPYSLGVWLGDGNSYNCSVVSMDTEIVAGVEADGYPVRRVAEEHGLATAYHFEGLRAAITASGIERRGPHRKFIKRIPAEYQRASIDQRLAVLQGLMDTDGYVAPDGGCELTLCDADLAADALELIRGLGIKASMNEGDAAYTRDGERKVTSRRFRIVFTTTERVVRLPRKAERLPETVRDTQKRLYITDIREADSVEMRCLRLDSTDKLYLTEGFVPTHNSILLQILMAGAILRDCDVFLIDPIKGGQDFDFAVPYVRAMVPQGDYLGAGELLQLIGREAEDRKKLNVLHKVGNYKDLPDGIRPRHMFVIIDEFQSLLKSQVRGLKEPTSGDETEMAIFEVQRNINTGVGKVATHIGKLAREARSVGITLVLAGQAMKAVDLEAVGLGGLKVNFSRIAVGKMSYGEMASAFKDPSTLPNLGAVVPPGRGIFESTAAQAITVQNWWEPGGQEELGRRLAESVPAIEDSRRVDIESLTARVLSSAPKAFGAVVDDEFEQEDEPVVLDAADLGIDLDDLSFDDMTFEADTEGEGTFTLEEPPTEHNLGRTEPEVHRDIPAAEPVDGQRPLFHPGQFVEVPHLLEGRIVIGADIVFGENSPTGDGFETGWPEGDALQLLLRANPGITEIVWADRMLAELDEIGIAREDIARDICQQFGAALLTRVDGEVQQKTVPPTDATAPALFEMDDFAEPVFERPAPKVPDMSDADSVFAPRKVSVPTSDGPDF